MVNIPWFSCRRCYDIKSKKGNIKGPIFSIELLGDAIMVTLKIEDSFVSVKVNNDFEASWRYRRYIN